MSTYVYSKERGLRKLLPHANFDKYKEKIAPSAIKVRKPSTNTLNKWIDAGVCLTPDKCRVEPDGTCCHGYPSWLIVLGHI